ncbi:protein indeterminate-domain 2-like [Durio zibethinus]|uniref:Protein indeterminate-domain 2-like n=1 Tax=Durio zibethinus TaxID=66656 RepID=A0A6P5WUS3_DURZI|nr:protein indeterminate-domain 2-like [Durio zibethinus]
MSNITGDNGGSFSSGNTAGEEVQQQQEQVKNFHGSNSLLSTNSSGSTTPQDQQPPSAKKKRNLPGTPDPNAEVIALSPKTLLATNRFVCEICNKGFQRDQNLQLHRRGHNLPWKLRQRTSNEIRKRVYVCPEPSCVHHNPARALGDLTGIKKHFCRKHGEKKWKCDKCSKKYAVQSDWKAHSKTCGTKEYKCDCGTIFSRRDSFITHRAFCDALTEENNKASQGLVAINVGSNLQGQVPDQLIPAIPINNSHDTSAMNVSDSFSHDTKSPIQLLNMAGSMFSNNPGNLFGGAKSHVSNSSSSCLQLTANSSTLFEGNGHLYSGLASMSATALLQKAAQMGATASTGSLNSPLMGKSFTTSMAPPSFVSMQTQNNNQSQVLGDDSEFTNQFMQKSQQEIQSEFFNANGGVDQSSAVNNMGMFSGVFDQNSALLKSVENDQRGASTNSGLSTPRTTCLSGFSGDMMTVDFLGIGGSRPRPLLEKQHLHQQQQDLDEFGGIDQARLLGLSHFQQHTALEKPMWKV